MQNIHYLGPAGSYSSIAASKYKESNQKDFTLVGHQSVSDIFTAIDKTQDIAIIPLENSTSGDVYESYKNLYEWNVRIIGSLILEIEHALIAKVGVTFDEIKTIYSHPQALMQVTKFSEKHHLVSHPTFSTMEACERVADLDDRTVAAIASPEAITGDERLAVIQSKISNNDLNYTRFLIIEPRTDDANKSLNILEPARELFLLFELKGDSVGELSKILQVLANYEINLNNIKSRPIEGQVFQYFFIIEANVEGIEKKQHEAIYANLKEMTAMIAYSVY